MQSPPNPYNQPPIPAPSDSPSAPNYGPPLPPQTSGISLAVLSEAWGILKLNSNYMSWIAAMLLSMAVSALTTIPATLTMDRSNPQEPTSTPISMIFSLTGWILNLIIAAGMAKMAIHTVRYGRADLHQIFSIGNVLGAVLGSAILVLLATVLGIMFFVLPGIWIGLSLCMTNFLVVDKNLNALEAIRTSWRAMQGHLLSLFLLLLVMALGGALPLICTCGLAFFVIGPLFQIALAIVYRNMFSPDSAPTPTAAAPYDPVNFR